MSEAKGSESKGKGKKKGKLPLILVVVLVIAGGGFFATSKGKKEEPKKPKIELGSVESLGEEFLLNLGNDGRTFLTCSISVQLRKPDPENKDDHVSAADPSGDAGHGTGDASYSVARDAVISVLSTKTAEDLGKPDAMKYLKREIAAALNHVLHHEEPAEEEDPQEKKKKEFEKAKGGHEEDSHGDGHGEIDHEWLDELGWDSEDGPVLKVLFNDFAYQKY